MRVKWITNLIIIFFFYTSLMAELKEIRISEVQHGNFYGWVTNEIVVKFSENTWQSFEESLLEKGKTGQPVFDAVNIKYQAISLIQKYPNAKTKIGLNGKLDIRGWFKIQFTNDINIEEAALEYRALPGVVDAQPIGIHYVSASPNDSHYFRQWHLNRDDDHDIDAPESWDIHKGSTNIIVAVMDSGVRWYHKDLGGQNATDDTSSATGWNARGNMWINSSELTGTDNVDDDGNGFLDDWIGWDFVDTTPLPFGDDYTDPDNDPRDYNGHGTHCSGIVAAINNNGSGVASPAGGWGDSGGEGNGVKVMGLRIGYHVSITGLISMSAAADALVYAADNGASIASCSWGSSDTGGLGDALDYFLYADEVNDQNVDPLNDPQTRLVFKAAGNDNNEESDYMLDRSDVIGVASTDTFDIKSDFSTYGTFVDISAPGSVIWSTYHNNEDPDNDYVAGMSGTSMATPLAAGVAAQVWSKVPALTATELEQILYNSSDDIYSIPENASYAGKLGVGRINANDALLLATGPNRLFDTGRIINPEHYSLMQNYPNPFNPSTIIRYQIPFAGKVNISVYNMLGQKIRSLYNTRQSRGAHSVQWLGRNDAGRQVGSGVYIYKMTAQNQDGQIVTLTKKMLLLR